MLLCRKKRRESLLCCYYYLPVGPFARRPFGFGAVVGRGEVRLNSNDFSGKSSENPRKSARREARKPASPFSGFFQGGPPLSLGPPGHYYLWQQPHAAPLTIQHTGLSHAMFNRM